MKYRIRVEVLDESAGFEGKFKEQTENGIECDGMCIIGIKAGSKATVVLHELSNLDIASVFAGNGNLLQSAIIAKGMFDGTEARKTVEMHESLGKLLGTAIEE